MNFCPAAALLALFLLFSVGHGSESPLRRLRSFRGDGESVVGSGDASVDESVDWSPRTWLAVRFDPAQRVLRTDDGRVFALLEVDGTSVTSSAAANDIAHAHAPLDAVNALSTHKDGEEECAEGEEHVPPSSSQFWEYIGVCLALVVLAGVMSGLTVGLFSIDPLKLNLLRADAHTPPEQRRRAEKLAPLLEKHHLLLVTLLIVNAASMEALPIFLDKLVPSYLAVIISVTLVLLFGEIIPQAVCTNDPLKIGARFSPVVRFFMVVVYPLAWPIAKLLDHLLGHEGSHWLFKRSELEVLIHMHGQSEGVLNVDEVTVMQGALRLKAKKAFDCLTPLEDVFMLEADSVLDAETIAAIMASGHSRVPVYRKSRHNVIGLILVKRLVLVDPDDERPVMDFCIRKPIVVPPDLPMYDLLNLFQTGRSHIALVTEDLELVRNGLIGGDEYVDPDESGALIGVITLEDVIEELIQEPIEDEQDRDILHRQRSQTQRTKRAVAHAVTKFKRMLTRVRKRRRGALHIEGGGSGLSSAASSAPSSAGGSLLPGQQAHSEYTPLLDDSNT